MSPTGRKYVPIRDRVELSGLGTVTPVYLVELTLQNFRCFKGENKFLFYDRTGRPARWTVIIGCNGTGKTTLLEAIACVYPVTGALRSAADSEIEDKTEAAADKEEVHWRIGHSAFEGSVSAFLKDSSDCDLRASAVFQARNLGVKSQQKISTQLEVVELKGRLDKYLKDIDRADGFHSLSISGVAGGGRSVIVRLGLTGRYPKRAYISLIAAYGAHRLPSFSDHVALGAKSANAIDSLFSPLARLTNAEEWLLQADYASRLDSTKKTYKDFDLINDALKRIIPSIGKLQIQTNSETRRPEVLFETAFGLFPLRNLSFGYQVTISWVIDLASRLMEHYPNSDSFLDEPAVVLVDEIDLHLHPSWQRMLMDNLSNVFTKTQFIVTAHSPLIVQNAPDANLILLKIDNDRIVIDNDPVSIDSWRIDQILTSDLFGFQSARSNKFESLLDERRAIKVKSVLSATDKARLKEIERQIGELPTAERTEDQEALDIIRKGAAYLKGLSRKDK